MNRGGPRGIFALQPPVSGGCCSGDRLEVACAVVGRGEHLDRPPAERDSSVGAKPAVSGCRFAVSDAVLDVVDDLGKQDDANRLAPFDAHALAVSAERDPDGAVADGRSGVAFGHLDHLGVGGAAYADALVAAFDRAPAGREL
jgi:hypothetical protein